MKRHRHTHKQTDLDVIMKKRKWETERQGERQIERKKEGEIMTGNEKFKSLEECKYRWRNGLIDNYLDRQID